jgi:hypothetical protein
MEAAPGNSALRATGHRAWLVLLLDATGSDAGPDRAPADAWSLSVAVVRTAGGRDCFVAAGVAGPSGRERDPSGP